MAYNHGPYIEECLESLANQVTNFEYEILVGEDCSTDDTRERVVKLAEKHKGVIRPLLYPENKGAHSNLTHLISQSTGKYVALCEGDDYWNGNYKLQQQVDILEQDTSVALVCTDADAFFQHSGRRILSVHERIGQWTNPPADMTLALITRKINIFTCTACFRRADLVRIFDENPYELSDEHPMSDVQMWIEASRLGKIVPIRRSMATYRVIKESASRSNNYGKVLRFQESALKIFEHYVLKFGYSGSVLHQVRMSQIWGMIQLALAHQDTDLKSHVSRIISSRAMNGATLAERIAFHSVRSRSKMAIVSRIILLHIKISSSKARISSLLRRICGGRTTF